MKEPGKKGSAAGKPEAVVFIGIPGSGKSTFYARRFFQSHVRINLDMLRTRNRERILFEACLQARQSFVVDNTNVTRADRAGYLQKAIEAGFSPIGYYFASSLAECLERNDRRGEPGRVPPVAVIAKHKKLEKPTMDEGFEFLLSVQIGKNGDFMLEAWNDEV